MYGFSRKPRSGSATADDPRGRGAADATINGVAGHGGDQADFYTDGSLACSVRPMVETVRLQAMPQGSVSFGRDRAGRLTATVNAFGLTPGSSHTVRILRFGGAAFADFGTLTADGTGQADVTLPSAATGRIPDGSRLFIGRDGPIGQTPAITVRRRTYQLMAVEPRPQGWATIAYYPVAKTVTITLSAHDLTPGAHAANIFLGSYRSQGPVQYMLMDFVANGSGQITHQVRTVTGVTDPISASGWYLRLHQGSSNNILANGKPTDDFRPLLCADI